MKKLISRTLLLIIACAFIWTLFKSTQINEDSSMLQNTSLAKNQLDLGVSNHNELMNIENDKNHELDVLLGTQHDEHDHAGHEHEEIESEITKVNKTAIDFELRTLNGNIAKLSDYKGRKVLLNFWTTWCPPCLEEMPELQRYYEESAEKNNVVILAVNITDQDLGIEKIREFVGNFELTFPILLDETGEVSISYQVLSIPASFIINEDGKIEEQVIGPLTMEKLHKLLGS